MHSTISFDPFTTLLWVN